MTRASEDLRSAVVICLVWSSWHLTSKLLLFFSPTSFLFFSSLLLQLASPLPSTHPRVLHLLNPFVRGEGNEADAMSDELVTEHCRVLFQLHPVYGDGRGLRHQDATDAVGHAAGFLLFLFLPPVTSYFTGSFPITPITPAASDQKLRVGFIYHHWRFRRCALDFDGPFRGNLAKDNNNKKND
ncbi:hypothetical protein E2C01_031739 [Portunus trituberculatus]|uniref:Uncharacterized protein n=1 Tax=Portunus trituberculatus TaxID=210409 RepID=A0A5B7EVI3_PORTR|nr:hypothetical protein [Portunus trituberculatus]